MTWQQTFDQVAEHYARLAMTRGCWAYAQQQVNNLWRTLAFDPALLERTWIYEIDPHDGVVRFLAADTPYSAALPLDPTNGLNNALRGDPGPAEGVINSPEEGRAAVRQRHEHDEHGDDAPPRGDGVLVAVADGRRRDDGEVERVEGREGVVVPAGLDSALPARRVSGVFESRDSSRKRREEGEDEQANADEQALHAVGLDQDESSLGHEASRLSAAASYAASASRCRPSRRWASLASSVVTPFMGTTPPVIPGLSATAQAPPPSPVLRLVAMPPTPSAQASTPTLPFFMAQKPIMF